MAHRKGFPPCVYCGAQDGKQTMTWAANDGEIPCWDVKCGWCGKTYRVGMFPLPEHASSSGLDESIRMQRRDQKRRRFGYVHPPEWMSSRGAKRIESDRLEATIRIQAGRVVPALRKRLGPPSRKAMFVGDVPDPKMCVECRQRFARKDRVCYTCAKENRDAA